jgi:hypothetical protein
LSKILPEFLLFNPRNVVNRLLLPFDSINNDKVSDIHIIINDPISQFADLVAYYLPKANVIQIYSRKLDADYISNLKTTLFTKSVLQITKSCNFGKNDIEGISQNIENIKFASYQPSCNTFRQFGASISIFVDEKGQKYGVREFRGARLSNSEIEAGGFIYIEDNDLKLFCEDLKL